MSAKELAEAGEPPEPFGCLQPIAARVLVKILYGARMARSDLLRAISYLASTVTKWTLSCNQDLHKLIAYINSTLSLRQVSWSGDPASALTQISLVASAPREAPLALPCWLRDRTPEL
eukprot:12885718-Prorocentrum_lima.AAC.1